MHTKPKKKLGQNFLVDNNIARKIVSGLNLSGDDVVLEIGAGSGELSCFIAGRVSSLLAVEIDPDLCGRLSVRLKACRNARVINADILKLDLRKLAGTPPTLLKVAGNIPYYISTPIIGHLFKYHGSICSAVITVQKEFAERAAARAGTKDYGSLSCFVQFYSRPKILFTISKNCFFPTPKVDSAVLELRFAKSHTLTAAREKFFFRIVRSAFGKRRKTLRNSLEGIVSASRLEAFFKRYSIDPDIRPERLAVRDFVNLAAEPSVNKKAKKILTKPPS